MNPDERGKFAMDAVAWAQVLLRIKQAATDNTPVELTGTEAGMVIRFTQLLAKGSQAVTDDRAEQLARAIMPGSFEFQGSWYHEKARKQALTYADRALAAIDVDPETYGYARLEYCRCAAGDQHFVTDHPKRFEP